MVLTFQKRVADDPWDRRHRKESRLLRARDPESQAEA